MWYMARFNLTLRNTVKKSFANDLSLSDLILVVDGRIFYSKTFLQTIGQHVSHSYWKQISCLKLLSYENLNDFFSEFSMWIPQLWLWRHQSIYWMLLKWKPAEMESKHITSKCYMALYQIIVKFFNKILSFS